MNYLNEKNIFIFFIQIFILLGLGDFSDIQKEKAVFVVEERPAHEWITTQEVVSPIYIKSGSQMAPRLLGRYPLMTEEESHLALDCALNAFENGNQTFSRRILFFDFVEQKTHDGFGQ